MRRPTSYPAVRTAFCMNVAVHMPIKENEDDDSNSESEIEDASAGVAPPADVTPVGRNDKICLRLNRA
jgi:hypothetical protein